MLWLRKRPLDTATVYGLGMSFSNSAFIGFPVAQQFLGPVASLALALTMMVENLVMFPLCISLAEAGSVRHVRFGKSLLAALAGLRKNPIVIAIASGLVFAVLGLRLPGPAAKAIDLFSQAAAPTALFFVGGTLVGTSFGAMVGDVTSVCVGKLVLHPLLVFAAIAILAPTDPSLSKAAILLACMPMMGIFPIFGEKYGLQGFCSAALLTTTLVSFATISVVLWIFF